MVRFRALSNLSAPLPLRLQALRNLAEAVPTRSDLRRDIEAYEQIRLKEIEVELSRIAASPADAEPQYDAIICELTDRRWQTGISNSVRARLADLLARPFCDYVASRTGEFEKTAQVNGFAEADHDLEEFLDQIRHLEQIGLQLSPEVALRVTALTETLSTFRERQAVKGVRGILSHCGVDLEPVPAAQLAGLGLLT